MQQFSSALAISSLLACALHAQGVAEAAEPNDTPATATLLPEGLQAHGEIDSSGTDEDWFRVTVATARDFKIWTGPGFTGQVGDTRVRLYAADGTTVLVDVDDGNNATHGYYTVFDGTLAAGDYYIGVRGFNSTTFGTYTLDVVLAPPGTYAQVTPALLPVAEGAEDNDPRNVGGVATTSDLWTMNGGENAVGAGGTGYTGSGDYDFYQIDITAPMTLTLETVAGAPSPASPDTVVHLVDSTLARIAYDDDGGAGALSRLVYSITTPGTYYAVVSSYGTNTGNYLLQILGDLAPLPVGTASVTVSPGGCASSAGVPALGIRASSTHPSAFPEMPVLGSEFWVDATNLPANAAMVRMIGLQARTTPFSLAPFGYPGCDIELFPVGLLFAVADPAGVHFWNTRTPANLAFNGLPLELQLLVLDPPPSLGLAVSNRLSAVCGIAH